MGVVISSVTELHLEQTMTAAVSRYVEQHLVMQNHLWKLIHRDSS